MTVEQFVEIRVDGQQAFLNLNQVATFKQAKGNDSFTEIMFSTGHTIIISIQYPEFRKSLGLDKK